MKFIERYRSGARNERIKQENIDDLNTGLATIFGLKVSTIQMKQHRVINEKKHHLAFTIEPQANL